MRLPEQQWELVNTFTGLGPFHNFERKAEELRASYGRVIAGALLIVFTVWLAHVAERNKTIVLVALVFANVIWVLMLNATWALRMLIGCKLIGPAATLAQTFRFKYIEPVFMRRLVGRSYPKEETSDEVISWITSRGMFAFVVSDPSANFLSDLFVEIESAGWRPRKLWTTGRAVGPWTRWTNRAVAETGWSQDEHIFVFKDERDAVEFKLRFI